MGPAVSMWASWALVAAYGAWVAWREIWPEALGLLRKAAALRAFAAPDGDAPWAVLSLTLRACGWLVAWVLICTAWSALLLWSGQLIHAGAPLARALFG